MIRIFTLSILVLGASLGVSLAQKIELNGFVQEKDSRERLPMVSVKVGQAGVLSNKYGFFSLTVSIGDTVSFTCLGYQPFQIVIGESTPTPILVDLSASVSNLAEVIIRRSTPRISSAYDLPVKAVKNIPSLLGEVDIIKALQLLPGVNRGTEGFAAFYVRGGGADQNLILLDEAPVYNANHVFGLFSAFNADAIRNITFWKDGFPARYGGRLSSVLDIQMKEGNNQKYKVEGGIGLVSSRLTIEGPIVRGKASFMISARRSYIDLIMKPLMADNEKITYNFYDLNAKLNWKPDDRNTFFLSTYLANDQLKEENRVTRSEYQRDVYGKLQWGNRTLSLRWNHRLNNRSFVNTTAYYTRYNFGVLEEDKRIYDFGTLTENLDFQSSLRDYSVKTELDYYLSNRHTLRAGGQWTLHGFTPRQFSASYPTANGNKRVSEFYRNQEVALYVEDEFVPNSRWKVHAGLRVSGLLGSSAGWVFPEPRTSVEYTFLKNVSVAASYSRTSQFVHQLSNTGLGLSTDLYVPVTPDTPPQRADQISGTLKKYLEKMDVEIFLSTYRKWMRNITAYKDGANFLSIGQKPEDIPWQGQVTSGRGKSYGSEVLVQKKGGRLSGWVGYTLSWTVHQFDELNNGRPFFPKFDRRHNLSVTGSYEAGKNVRLTANWVYYSGNYVNAPYAFSYGMGRHSIYDPGFSASREYTGNRNSFKSRDYHRLDVGIQFHKEKKWGRRYWEISVYNAYLRQNPAYHYIWYDRKQVGTKRAEVRGKAMFSIIPSVSYNFTISNL